MRETIESRKWETDGDEYNYTRRDLGNSSHRVVGRKLLQEKSLLGGSFRPVDVCS